MVTVALPLFVNFYRLLSVITVHFTVTLQFQWVSNGLDRCQLMGVAERAVELEATVDDNLAVVDEPPVLPRRSQRERRRPAYLSEYVE